MNPSDLAAFNQAIQIAQSGQKAAAYALLNEIARQDDNHKDPNLLLWMAFTAPNLAASEQILTAANKIDPHNANLAAARDWLEKEKAKQAPQPARVTAQAQPQYVQPAMPVYAQPPVNSYQVAQPVYQQPYYPPQNYPVKRPSPLSTKAGFGNVMLPVWVWLLIGFAILAVIGSITQAINPTKPTTTASSSSSSSTSSIPGLGVSRALGQATFPEFTFDNSPLKDGTPRYLGRSQNRVDILELTGPSDNLTSISLLSVVDPKNKNVTESSASYMLKVLGLTAPSITNRDAWFSKQVKTAGDTGQEAVEIVGGVKITIAVHKEISTVSMTVEAI